MNNPLSSMFNFFGLKLSLQAIRLEEFIPTTETDKAWLEAFLHAYHSTREDLIPDRTDLTNPKINYFKAYVNKRFIGISGYKILSPTHAEITKTIIIPEERGKGYGEMLAAQMVDLLKERGFKKALSVVYTTNLPMIFIRLKQGFLVEGLLRNADAPGIHEYHMGKELE